MTLPILGVCGDNCDECPRGVATRTGDEALLEKVLDLWIKTGLRPAGTPAFSLLCHGCSTVPSCAYQAQKDCAIVRELENCGMCMEYPCGVVKEAFKRSDEFAERCRNECSKDEYERFNRAFFSKKKYLDEMHAYHSKSK